MANAQIMQEELQQSVVLSEEDAEFEEDNADAMDVGTGQDDGSYKPTPPNPGARSKPDDEEAVYENIPETISEQDKVNIKITQEVLADEDDEDDAEGEPDEDDDASEADDGSQSQGDSVHDEDDGFDEDAEGEDDDIDMEAPLVEQNGALTGEEEEEEDDDDDDDDEEDEAEGVGAVKIKPGETEDEEESGSDDDVASSVSGISYGESAGESAGDWEGEAEINNDDDDDEEESETADSSLCMFCKKDEENDPSEEFESYLACKGCGEHGKSVLLYLEDHVLMQYLQHTNNAPEMRKLQPQRAVSPGLANNCKCCFGALC
jgi:histone acetyltransferase SAS3